MRGEVILSAYFHKPTRDEFKACISWLRRHKFQFLSTADLECIIEAQLPLPKGAVVLTLDDGWQSNEGCVADVAEKFQVPVTVHVSSEPVEQGAYWWSFVTKAKQLDIPTPAKSVLKTYHNQARLRVVNSLREKLTIPREALTVAQIKRMAAGGFITIGGHTHTHPILINCSVQEVFNELNHSKLKLESWANTSVTSFAYPNGDYGEREIEILKDLNYRIAFTTKSVYLTQERLKHRYELPRFGFLEGASRAENICRITGVWQTFTAQFKLPLLSQKDKAASLSPQSRSINSPAAPRKREKAAP